MKKLIAILLAALTAASAFGLTAFADGIPEENSADETAVTAGPADGEPDISVPEDRAEIPGGTGETAEEPAPANAPHAVIIADGRVENGYVVPSRRTAREGDAVILTAYEKEYTEDGKKMKSEFIGFETDGDTVMIPTGAFSAFFFMPDGDITVTAVYREIDLTEYYDWKTAADKICRAPEGGSVYIDMKNETEADGGILSLLSGRDVTVSFMTQNCYYSLNGKEIPADEEDAGYSLTYEDCSLPRYFRLKLGGSVIGAFDVKAEGRADVTARLHCFCGKDAASAYLFRLTGPDAEFVSAVSVANGEAEIPVTESGLYAIATRVPAGTAVSVKADADSRVLVNGKVYPLCAYRDGSLLFTVPSSGTVEIEPYGASFADIRNHPCADAIRTAAARNLMDGADDTSFRPDAAASIEDILCAVARLRRISDSSAASFCAQAGILAGYYEPGSILTRSDVSLILSDLAGYVTAHPEQFGAAKGDLFGTGASAWIGMLMLNAPGSDGASGWTGVCTRGELAYVLTGMTDRMAGGNAR